MKNFQIIFIVCPSTYSFQYSELTFVTRLECTRNLRVHNGYRDIGKHLDVDRRQGFPSPTNHKGKIASLLSHLFPQHNTCCFFEIEAIKAITDKASDDKEDVMKKMMKLKVLLSFPLLIHGIKDGLSFCMISPS